MIEDLFAAALLQQRSGQAAAAESLYRRILATHPRHVDSLHLLGVIAARSGRAEEAVGLIGKAVALSPDFALAHFNLGNALRSLGRNEAAVTAFSNAARFDPRHAPARNNLGAALRAVGRGDEAVAAYRQAIALRAEYPEARYNLGVALSDLSRREEALDAYWGAIAQKPDYADAFINIGVTLQALGRSSEAVAAFQRAIEIDPAQAEARVGLGVALHELGRHDAALAALDRALELQPSAATTHVRRGVSLWRLGRAGEALAAYRAALALQPDLVEAHVSLGVSLQELGQAAEAADAVSRALAIDPASARAWFIRSDLKTFAPGDPDITVMEALLAGADARQLALEDRLDLEFALGKAWMDAGDADRAFARLDDANRRKRASLDYDVAADVARFEASAGAYTPELMRRLASAGDPSDLPVFIVGMPRSGTTLVEQILASHPEVHGAGELNLLNELVGAVPAAADLTRERLGRWGTAYAGGVGALGPGKRRVVDKMPSNFQFAGLIGLMLPNARIVHCRRDPVDTCLSCYSKKFAGRQDFAYDLDDLGRYYRAYDALMAHCRGLLPADRFLEIGYEDVVADLSSQAERLVGFLGLPWDDACLDFHRTARTVRTASVNQVRQPIYRSSVARWKPYAAHLGPLLSALGIVGAAER